MGSTIAYTVRDVDDIVVVTLGTTLVDEATIAAMGVQLHARIDAGCRRLIVNALALDHVASSFLGKLIGLLKKMQAVGGRMIVCPSPVYREILRVTQTLKFFEIVSSSEQDALAAMRAPKE